MQSLLNTDKIQGFTDSNGPCMQAPGCGHGCETRYQLLQEACNG